MKRTFTTKGYGRIYVAKESDIKTVENIIETIDEFEYGYLPKDFIAPFSEYPKLVFTHKFDALDINLLTAMCFEVGGYIFCLDNGYDDFIKDGKGSRI